METQICRCHTVALCWGRFRKGTMAAALVLSGRNPCPSSFPDARHFSFSLYALQGAAQVLAPEGVNLSKFVERGLSNGRFLRIPQFLLPTQPPLFFIARSYGDLSSWCWNPGLGVLVWGWNPSLLRYPSSLCPPRVGLGPAHPVSPHFHSSVPPAHLGECGFFNSLVVGTSI